ncbi:MAG: PepSY domain-containing protein, partial [Proteobacteria bacterium]
MVDKKSETKGFWDFILRLHREYLLGFYGKLLVAVIGLFFIASLLSGFYLYGPTALKLSYGSIRRGKRSWTFADIHKLIGITTFSWMMLMGVSGFLLGISGQLLQIFQYTELKSLSAQYGQATESSNPVSLDVAVKAVMAVRPDSEMSFITFPGTEYSTPVHYIFVMNGTESWNKYLSELVLVDAGTGQVTEERALPWYLKAAVLSEPLHFGNY